MKIKVTFKTPDAIDDATEDLDDYQQSRAKQVMHKYIRYGEYINVEFDIEKGTATVLEAK